MLLDYLKNGFFEENDYSCSENILIGANEAYGLGLSREACKVASGFGAGVMVGDICGAITGSVMVLGVMFVEERAHTSDRITPLVKEFIERYRAQMKEVDCGPLKDLYRTEEYACREVIYKAAEILDDIVARERAQKA